MRHDRKFEHSTPLDQPKLRPGSRLVSWLITIATVVAMIGLARVHPWTAWLIALGGLSCLLALFYVAGVRTRAHRGRN